MEEKELTGEPVGNSIPAEGTANEHSNKPGMFGETGLQWLGRNEGEEGKEERKEEEGRGWREGGRAKICFFCFSKLPLPGVQRKAEGLSEKPRRRPWGLDLNGVGRRGRSLRMEMCFGIRANRIC